MILLVVFAIGGLIGCWIWGDVTIRTKCVFSVLYATSWGLLFIPFHSLYLFPLAQCGFAVLFGGMAFGVNWLMRDAWHWR